MRVEAGSVEDFDRPADAYRKTSLTYAVQMFTPFEVDTIEGLHTGKAGDYLAIGAQGEMYPIDLAVFEATYESMHALGSTPRDPNDPSDEGPA